MTEVVLYHHVQGLTDGVRSFADELRQAGHTVHTPDLFDGRTFDSIDEGMAFARETGSERSPSAAWPPPRLSRPSVVYGGFSFGVMRRPAARADPARRARRAAHVLLPAGLGVRGGVARRRSGAGARQGGRPVLPRGHRRRPRPRRLDRPGGALPLSRATEHLFADSVARRPTTRPPRSC